jgi:uncharacterized protein (TIGR02145 family)
MDRNLGATQVATSSTDAAAYGDLYQWGRGSDGHQLRTSATTTALSSTDDPGHGGFITSDSLPFDWRVSPNNTLWQPETSANNPCPAGFSLPTDAEWETELASWPSSNSAGAFASPLKLVVGGFRFYSGGTLYWVGSSGLYWSGSVDGNDAHNLNFDGGGANRFSSQRADGLSVRCIMD